MQTQTITSDRNEKLPYGSRTFVFPLHLPREHGAVVAFLFSTALAFKAGSASMTALLPVLAILWLIFLLSHRPRQAFWLSIVAAVGLAISNNLAAALLIAVFAVGLRALAFVGTTLGTGWREALGMSGVSAAPLVAAMLSAGSTIETWTSTLAFTAATVLASAMIHILHRDPERSGMPALLVALLLWMCLWAENPAVFFSCLVPFPGQLLLLLAKSRPDFKLLGALETIAVAWVSIYLWIGLSA